MTEVEVSRNRPRPRDRQRKSKPGKAKGIAFITVESDGTAALVTCSCGADKFHKRKKVAEDWAERHVAKKHKGRAVWQEA